ncbi:hypothetical protein Tco_1310820 [Tanacetum coccineum]
MRKRNTPKPGSQSAKSSKADMPEGCCRCDKCNNIDYPFRTKCKRHNCGVQKPLESQNSSTKEEDNDQKDNGAIAAKNGLQPMKIGRGNSVASFAMAWWVELVVEAVLDSDGGEEAWWWRR